MAKAIMIEQCTIMLSVKGKEWVGATALLREVI